jgi:D-glycero-D-manno-heptose 1,7-bisphosphate phosphatase
MKKVKAVFLDRDGTLNKDVEGYIDKPERFELFSYSASAVKELNRSDFKVFIVTNQSGIARGLYTENDLKIIHKKMKEELGKCDAVIDEIFFSPYHSEGKIRPFNIEHEDRKPGLGLFYRATSKYELDMKNSYMIGDKSSDIEFGTKAGLRTILVFSGNGEDEFMNHRNNWDFLPDLVVKDLKTAVKVILNLGDKF